MTAASSTSSPIVMDEVDASCRWPLLGLFKGAAFWLVAGSVFSLIASIKFHSPTFLADCAWLTYGRVHAASTNSLLYGFCIPAGVGVMLWLISTLGGARFVGVPVAMAASGLWHLGVLLGIVGILRGGSTGFEWMEMPRYAAVMMFTAFLVLAACAFAAFQRREEGSLYPSVWFILSALLLFPWIFSTGYLLLVVSPVRGAVQASVNWWFAGNLLNVWLVLAALAVVFYFVPKLLERPLHSQYLALFAFWTLILFGTWTGIPAGAPLPAWMPALSSMAGVLVVVPTLTIAAMLLGTQRGATNTAASASPLAFVRFGGWSFVLAGLLLAISSLPVVSHVLDYTWIGPAQAYLRMYGFTMTMFGAAYFILPRVTGYEFPLAKLARIHFWLMVAGVVLLVLPLALGGVLQGVKAQDAALPLVNIARSTLMPLRLSSTGETLLVLGNLMFFANVMGLLLKSVRGLVHAIVPCERASLETAEVKP